MSNQVQELLESYKSLLSKVKAYNEAINLMFWDLKTGAPKAAVDGRSEVIGILSTEVFNLMTSPEMENLLEELLKEENKQQIDAKTLKSIYESKKEFDRNKKIPVDMYRDYVVLISKSEAVWEEAKVNSDFALFKPHLKLIVKYNKKFTELWGYTGNRYNALLDQYEPGTTVEQLDPLFEELREALIPLVQKVANAKQINSKFLHKEYNVDKQREFSNFILKKMGYDFNAGRLDTTLHPFQITINSSDVRITTRFDESELASGIFSSMHEGGHALYEQNIDKDLEELLLAEGTSMGIHESQSRFWENIIGRSESIWKHYYKNLVALFPEQLGEVSVRDFYKAINEIKPSPIRIEADELTYNFHIMIRYEIEKKLINGELEVDDLPAYWNQKMEEYLGIIPENDSEGVLQDVHWSEGMFGYFPSYALGNIYSAQLYNKMKEDLPELKEMLCLGNLIPIKAWLNKHIHQYGKLKTPSELIFDATGEKLNAKYLIDYLTAKINDIYEI